MQTSEQHQDFVSRLFSDQALRARMLAEPASVLQEQGIDVPPGAEFRVVEDSADVCHVIMPPSPNATLADSSMESVAGGVGGVPPLSNPAGLPLVLGLAIGVAAAHAAAGAAGS